MKDIIHFEPVTRETYDSYIEIGIRAYNQHYLHLWPDEDTSPYIENSFTRAVLEKEEKDENTILYRILLSGTTVGILKFTLDAALKSFTKKEALYVDKIYILNEYSGKGIGQKAVQFVILRAKELKKKIVWLYTMQIGPALNFYIKNGFEIYGKNQVKFPTVIEAESLMWVMVKEI